MGLRLQSTLDPMLQRLMDVAHSKYVGEVLALHPLGDSRSEAEQIAEDIENEFRQLIGPDLNNLVTRFRGYYSLDGYDLDPLANCFATPSDRWETPTGGSVFSHIAQASDDVNDVAKLVHSEQWTEPTDHGTWQGQGAMAFRDKFLIPFKTTAVVNSGCARELATAASALASAVELSKECVVWICGHAIEILGGAAFSGETPGTEEESKPGSQKAAAWGAILSDSVALFLALTAPELDLLDVGLAAAGVSGGLIAESKGSILAEPIDFSSGAIVKFTLANVETALTALDHNIAALDEQINRGLEADLGPSGMFASRFARTNSPDVGPATYHALDYKGLDDVNDQVVVGVVRLYYAGYVTLPAAAAMYGLGVSVCQGAVISGVQNQFPRSVPKFNEAADTLRGLMSAVRDDLSSAGLAMVSAARGFESADAYEMQMIKQYTDQIPSPGDSSSENYYTPPSWLIP